MNLDELQSVQARERQSSDLQHLRSSFYEEVGEFIQDLRAERARVVDRVDDPFSSSEVRRLTDDIETAEATVEAIYERRVGKVVKKASIAAADMPVEVDGLTAEERALFEDLVDRIESNRQTVFSVLDGESPSVSCSIENATQSDEVLAGADGEPNAELDPEPGTRPEPELGADVEGDTKEKEVDRVESTPVEPDAGRVGSNASSVSNTESVDSPSRSTTPTSDPAGRSGEEIDAPSATATDSGDGISAADLMGDADPASTGERRDEPTEGEPTSTVDSADRTESVEVPRTTVRITADVGEVVGTDDRDYDLGPEDVVTLPEPNAEVLLQKDAAERIE